jgi:hypothetical protein
MYSNLQFHKTINVNNILKERTVSLIHIKKNEKIHI